MKTLSISQFRVKKNIPKPPPELGSHGRAIWEQLSAEYDFQDSGGLTSLLVVCRSEDDVQRMRETVRVEGDLVPGRVAGQRIVHPLLAAIRGVEQVRARALRALNLETSAGKPAGHKS